MPRALYAPDGFELPPGPVEVLTSDVKNWGGWKFLEGGAVTAIDDTGGVATVGDERRHHAVLIVPHAAGRQIADELDRLARNYHQELTDLDIKYDSFLVRVVPEFVLRGSENEGPPEDFVLGDCHRDRFPEGSRVEVIDGPFKGRSGEIIDIGYSAPAVKFDDDGAVVEFHRPEHLRAVDDAKIQDMTDWCNVSTDYLDPGPTNGDTAAESPNVDTKNLGVRSLMRLVQAGIVATAQDEGAVDGVVFNLTEKGDRLLTELLVAVDRGPSFGVCVSPERNPAVDGHELDIKFVPQPQSRADASEPQDCSHEIECPRCGSVLSVSGDSVDYGGEPAPTPADIAAGLRVREKAVLLLCRKPRSVLFMEDHSRYASTTLYRAKNDLVERGLVAYAQLRDYKHSSNTKLWCLTDLGRAVVQELMKGNKP